MARTVDERAVPALDAEWNGRRIHIGTSGWHYEHWEGPFFPVGSSSQEWLDHYSERFQDVELNNTFYQLPKVSTLGNWKERTPDGFLFTTNANRYITHMKHLKDPRPSVGIFLKRVRVLEPKLGPILFQLPPSWNFNRQRLESFLPSLPASQRYAFELRDPTWINDEAFELLQEYEAAFCMYQFDGRLSPKWLTADFVYVRLHGPKGAYQVSFDISKLAGWAGAISSWVRQGKEVFCFFDNDQSGHAAQKALRLKNMLRKEN